jgi:hypothetical protein
LGVLEWFVAQWPLVVAGGVAVMGIAAWIEQLKRVQELELKARQLERQEQDLANRVVAPTPAEVERYAGSGSSRLRKVLRKPDLLLGLALSGPLIAAVYQEYRAHETVSTIDAQLAQTQQQISIVDVRLNEANRALGQATAELEAELTGTGGTRLPGAGPVYREKRARRDSVAAEVERLAAEKLGVEERRRTLENERRRLPALPWN